jgi:hypothetical protein
MVVSMVRARRVRIIGFLGLRPIEAVSRSSAVGSIMMYLSLRTVCALDMHLKRGRSAGPRDGGLGT